MGTGVEGLSTMIQGRHVMGFTLMLSFGRFGVHVDLSAVCGPAWALTLRIQGWVVKLDPELKNDRSL